MAVSIRWAFNIKEWKPSRDEWEFAIKCVQKEEKERIRRFVYSNDAKSAMVGRLLMRKAASFFTGIPYDRLRFSRTQNGKPYISNCYENSVVQQYNFNVSHNGDFCVLAAESDCCVGVDVMKIQYRGSSLLSDYFGLMKKQFSHSEYEFITEPILEKQQLERFFRLWCLKESYVKAKGTGISSSLKDIDFRCKTLLLSPDVVTADSVLVLNGKPTSDWQFQEMLIGLSHCVAVAVENKGSENGFLPSRPSPPLFLEMSYEKLMENSVPFETCDENDWLEFLGKQNKPG